MWCYYCCCIAIIVAVINVDFIIAIIISIYILIISLILFLFHYYCFLHGGKCICVFSRESQYCSMLLHIDEHHVLVSAANVTISEPDDAGV